MKVQQNDSIEVYLLYDNAMLEAIYTSKPQAEADMRKLQRLYPDGVFWIRERTTVQHDNNR